VWLLGIVALPAAGSLTHVLLVIALIVIIFQMLSGRRAALSSAELRLERAVFPVDDGRARLLSSPFARSGVTR
jgi:hypothetical protein